MPSDVSRKSVGISARYGRRSEGRRPRRMPEPIREAENAASGVQTRRNASESPTQVTRCRRLAAVLVALALPACSSGHPATAPVHDSTGPPGTYVAIGASETVGVGSDVPLRDAWPQVFFRTALPRNTVF